MCKVKNLTALGAEHMMMLHNSSVKPVRGIRNQNLSDQSGIGQKI